MRELRQHQRLQLNTEGSLTVYTTVQSAAIEVVNKILNLVQQRVSDPSDWYVGITDYPERRLFAEHLVRKEDIGSYIYLPMPDRETADFVERHLTDPVFGRMDGGPGGDTKGCFVYAYMKKAHIKP
jgi:hypothetical protein